jgi:ABC-type glycerol-3-phosphate transport system substrate-binding protein
LYQIEVREYLNQADIPFGTLTQDVLMDLFNQALFRFQVDLMAGNVPDLIVQPTSEMVDRGMLLDLYPFIDADPEINRADFFPNVLSSMERPYGMLPYISNRFSVSTIISRKATIEHIGTWTPDKMLLLIQNSQNMLLPFGTNLMRDNFANLFINFFNTGFTDFDTYRANFDSNEFISFLEAAKLLPSISDIPPEIFAHGDPTLQILRLKAGEHLLCYTNIYGPSGYQSYADTIEDYIAIGIPTVKGGEHIIMPLFQFGIGATTKHPDVAWKFVRGFLLPSAAELDQSTYGDIGIPIRIDLFNEMLEDAKTPRTFLSETGNTVEYPRDTLSVYDGSGEIRIFAMSDETANSLLALIESAVPLESGIGADLWEIIEGDLADFYSGARSAEETARLIQNRAERWLSEQELLTSE